MIEVDTLLDLPTITNLVIINKDTSRLSKADKHQRKMDMRQAGRGENEPSPKNTLTLDLKLMNTILLGNKKISLHNPAEIIDKISNCYVSKFDFLDFFFSIKLCSDSKGNKSFYYKNETNNFDSLFQ